MVLAQRQKNRSMEQDRKPRDKSTHLWTKEARIYNGKKTISLTSGAGKTGQPPVKNETRILFNTIHKNKLKMDKCKTRNYILLEESIGKTLSDINHSRILYDPPPRVVEIKAKINK